LARGWCGLHYQRWPAHGTPGPAALTVGRPTPEERFWIKVRQTDTCWLWTSTLNNRGYGQFSVGGRSVLAHRFSYELHVGPIPEGLHLDHLCRVRHCVNPAHLEPVTNQENNRRGDTGAHLRDRTHCPAGHPYEGANLYVNGNTGARSCRICMCRRKVEYRERLKNASTD